MSARTPFVPSGVRPASRAAHLQDQPNPQKSNTQFSIDLSNPLHAMPNSAATPPLAGVPFQSAKTNTGNSDKGGNRPLNTSGLLKRKNLPSQGHQNQGATRRPCAVENAPKRPGTADPRSKTCQEQKQMPVRNNSLTIVAPAPRQAPSSPGLLSSLVSDVFTTNNSQHVFRTPALPLPSSPQPSSDEQPKNDTHISSSALGFSFSNPHMPSEAHMSQLPTPPTTIRTTNTRSSLALDVDVPLPPFSLNMSNSNQSGPQRVLVNSDGTRGPLVDQDPAVDDDPSTSNRIGSALPKRSHAHLADDADHQPASGDYKRYRNEAENRRSSFFIPAQNVYNQQAKSIASHPSSPGKHSAHSPNHNRSPEVLENEPRSSHQHRPPLTPPDNEHVRQDSYFYHNHAALYQQTANDGPRPLDKLLGCDVDIFVEEHADQYERAAARWKQSTMAEWVAGADEQVARYSKILDFVKDHMTAKMKLFASFEADVDGHNAVLSARARNLEAVKDRLVQESANVLGSGRQ
ncbi:hypothetical protein LshimejAT787_1801340 [Lyophyllum shimeji]|uniref:Extracellular mutant protein 11 C-terminal domain-containing protein n=1 Tax=Lyophyllum shimeji TaxID=47721 RepID=A0A9P3PXF0_LYOSH|nr:hypothetical protein LshimejAT787_1801340 [Lyophyllum shimeji]